MYFSRTLGPLELQLFAQLSPQISFSDFCAPRATIEFAATPELLQAHFVLFRISFPGYVLEAKVKDGLVYIWRNGFYQHSNALLVPSRCRVALQWDVDAIYCGVAPYSDDLSLMNNYMRAVRTPPTVPPPELVRTLRTENLLVNSAYRSPDDFYITVLDCLHLCEVDIRKFGSQRLVWGKNGDLNHSQDEPEISRFVATFLAAHGAARNFDVTCEGRAGSGSLDFFAVAPVQSSGLAKIAIEAKKAEHAHLVHGLSVQLPSYMHSLGTNMGVFLTYWLKSEKYPHPAFESYGQLETKLLHPKIRPYGVRTVSIDLSTGPTPSKISL